MDFPPQRLEEIQVMLECLARKVRRHPSVTDFEDVVQDGWVGVLDAAGRFNPEKSGEDTYFHLRARGAMLDGVRRLDPYARQRQKGVAGLAVYVPVEKLAGYLPATTEAPDEQVWCRELKEAIEDAMTALTSLQRETVRLRFWGRLTEAEVAGILGGVTPQAVHERLRSARQTMKEVLQGVEA